MAHVQLDPLPVDLFQTRPVSIFVCVNEWIIPLFIAIMGIYKVEV